MSNILKQQKKTRIIMHKVLKLGSPTLILGFKKNSFPHRKNVSQVPGKVSVMSDGPVASAAWPALHKGIATVSPSANYGAADHRPRGRTQTTSHRRGRGTKATRSVLDRVKWSLFKSRDISSTTFFIIFLGGYISLVKNNNKSPPSIVSLPKRRVGVQSTSRATHCFHRPW